MEKVFEAAIATELGNALGWDKGLSNGYRPDLGLDTGELFTFIGATQKRAFDKLITAYGDLPTAQREFAARVASEIDKRGALDVLRNGVRDRGATIQLCYFRPGHTLAASALDDYNANRLTVVRQLRYSAKTQDELDLTLFVNGIPIATAELKNPLTGQDVESAKKQYRTDRDPKELIFARRTLVHFFAVDPHLVFFVTTRLAGAETRFLPFNVGTHGPGRSGGAGNPPADDGDYQTSYLWRQVWQRDNFLDLLHRFVHVAVPKKGRPNPHSSPMVFPRFHQWHAVREMTRHALREGAGHNYLIEHSAGSGKSNTIAWLAHRLSTLHDAGSKPVFDKVIVITDRVVLDRQLQHTIYQFDHVPGVVKKIDEDAQQLAAALTGATSRVIITTLQKFPFILDKVSQLADQRYAVIIDEAHSSQSGESANALKKALGRLGSTRSTTTAIRLPRRRWRVASTPTCPTSRSPPPRSRRRLRSSGPVARTPATWGRFTSTRCGRPSTRLHPRRAAQLHHLRGALAPRQRGRRSGRVRRSRGRPQEGQGQAGTRRGAAPGVARSAGADHRRALPQ